MRKIKYRDLTAEELAAITEYAATHGRTWKEKLSTDWMYARTRGALQTLRNDLGPAWLYQFKLPKPEVQS